METKSEYRRGADFIPEQGDTVKWREHPDLEAEVRVKVAETLLDPTGKQIISSEDGLKYLKKKLGLNLAAIVCRLSEEDLPKFIRSKKPLMLSAIQRHNVAAAYVICDILFSHLPEGRVLDWLTTHSSYLHGVPAVEMTKRPDDVRLAALFLISSGDNPIES